MADRPGSGRALAPRTLRLDACPVCGHGGTAFSFASIDLLHGVPGVFAYERCPSCRSVFQNPRTIDDDLPACYPELYFTHGDADAQGPTVAPGPLQALVRQLVLESGSRSDRWGADLRGLAGRLLHAIGFVRRRAMFGLVDELGPPTRGGRCLELGPGTGDDMWRLSQLGWRVTGIDLDPRAAEVAAARSGCEVIVGSVLDHRPREPYALIYGSHSIEHVPRIRDTVIHLRSLLGAGGRLVLIIPNPWSLSSRLYGPLSVVWDPPRHLSLPSVRALRMLLADTGFDCVRVRTLSRRAAHYCAIARARRLGATGMAAWSTKATGTERFVQATEAFLVRLGSQVGEEIIVSATVR